MSGLAGIFNLTAEPVRPELLSRMTAAIPHRGPDGIQHVVDGPIAIGHCMLCTTPESLHEAQPLWDEKQRYCLAMDGRVDNRTELTTDLKNAGMVLRDDTDAELVLKAFLVWGNDSPCRIVGDYAYVIWNRWDQTLFCARDHIGIKPFYYYTNGRIFAWASEIQQLFKLPFVPKEPNEGMVAEYLADQITSLEETLYVGLMRLTPAHFMVVKRSSINKKRYWDLDPKRTIRYKAKNEYADHLRTILAEAVKCRLRTNAAVGAELSGGLDSSTVVGLVASLMQRGEANVNSFETFSLNFPGLPCDETEYIESVLNLWKPSHTGILGCPHINSMEPRMREHQSFPDSPNGDMSIGISHICHKSKIRVLLSGIGGDDWLTGLAMPGVLGFIKAVAGCSPVLRHTWQVLRRKRNLKAYTWINSSLSTHVGLADRLLRIPSVQPESRYQDLLKRTLTDGYNIHALDASERLQARYSIEYRHPFQDRRLLEFAFNLPFYCTHWTKESKPLMRNAVQRLLPQKILKRTTKADFSLMFYPYLDSFRSRIQTLQIAKLGWVHQDLALELYQEFIESWNRGFRQNLFTMWPIWMILGVELWYSANLQKEN